jgi:transcriptional regulator with XRE-family HTH domain
MASTPLVTGPTALRTAKNVERFRKARGLDQKGLSARTKAAGRPMVPTVISKIERADRRVDVDDLVALAIALDVSPSRLLMPAGVGDEDVALTDEVTVSAREAWEWVSGTRPLPADPDPNGSPAMVNFDRNTRFARENRPHDPPDSASLAELAERAEDMKELWAVVGRLRESGLSLSSIKAAVNFHETVGAAMVERMMSRRLRPVDPPRGKFFDVPPSSDAD